ncbi:Uncharacterised protein [Klebsiella pneumoniae]|nr:Uncharacterised protein [Klebsiella pneumoniae]SVJ35056.1 Uncharacterised protein [Klebsiella pneumoniae]
MNNQSKNMTEHITILFHQAQQAMIVLMPIGGKISAK